MFDTSNTAAEPDKVSARVLPAAGTGPTVLAP
jgi:hypothetical protein